MSRLDVCWLGRQPGIIVRNAGDIAKARPRAFTREGWLAVLAAAFLVCGLIWTMAALWFLV